MILAIIPARGGSKSIPQKNIAIVAGRPLIAYTIDAAKGCRGLDRVIVSTDSPEIADVCRDHGVGVPFLRPEELARDDTPGVDPVLHALEWLEREEGYIPDGVMLLQPTSPLRTTADISAVIALWTEQQCDAVVSVRPTHDHPYWTKRLNAQGFLENFLMRDQPALRRQDLPEALVLNGAVYLARRDILKAQRTFMPGNTIPYIMPPERSIDIDEPWDLYLTELILRESVKHKSHENQ